MFKQEHEDKDVELYLSSLRFQATTGKAQFRESVIDIALELWQELRDYFLFLGFCLEVPDACPGQKNNFMYVWSRNEHYLECEILGEDIEFFYRNKITAQVWAEDTTFEKNFSTPLIDKISLFTTPIPLLG